MNNLADFLGGLDKFIDNNKTIIIYGGDSAKDNMTIVCSWRILYNLRNKLFNWQAFIGYYWDDDNDDGIVDKDKDKFFEEVKNLLCIDQQLSNDKIYLFINKILSIREDIFIKKIKKEFNAHACLSMALSEMFVVFKKYFEKLIKKFAIERNKYIKLHDTPDTKTNIKLLNDKWNKTDSIYDNMSSSILLYYFMPQKTVNKSKLKIPHYKINITTDDIELSDTLSLLKKKLKKFSYPGFCSKFPLSHMMKLLLFPMEEFENCLLLLDNTYEPTNFYPAYQLLKINTHILMKQIKQIKHMYKSSNQHFKHVNINSNSNIRIIKNNIDKILDNYSSIYLKLQMIEEFYDTLANVISHLTKILRDDIFI